MLSLPLSPSNSLFGHHSKKFLVGRERLELPEALATWFTVKTATNYGLSAQILNKYVEGGRHCQRQNINRAYVKERREGRSLRIWRCAQDSNLQAFYSQRFSRPLPHRPDTQHI